MCMFHKELREKYQLLLNHKKLIILTLGGPVNGKLVPKKKVLCRYVQPHKNIDVLKPTQSSGRKIKLASQSLLERTLETTKIKLLYVMFSRKRY